MKLLSIVQESILTEGRKEDVYKKYWVEFQTLGAEYGDLEAQYKALIESFSDADPSGNNKYLDWMIKSQLEILKGNYKVPKNVNADDFIVNLINSFNKNQQRITQEFAKQKGFSKHVVDSPRDINVYNIRDLKIMTDMLDREKAAQQNLSDAYVLYENEKWLILSPKSYEASCKYGAGTKWCVASKKSTQHFQSYTNSGKLVFVIDKTDKAFTPGLPYNENPMYKMAVHYNSTNRSITIWNAPDKQIGSDLSYFFAPNIQTLIISFFNRSKEQIDTLWKDNIREIYDSFEGEDAESSFHNWRPYVSDAIYLDPPYDINYRLRVLPYNMFVDGDEGARTESLVVELVKDQTATSDEEVIDEWEEFLGFHNGNQVDYVYNIVDRIITEEVNNTIIFDILKNEVPAHKFTGGWTFTLNQGEEYDMIFGSNNESLSSLYWDKFDIRLTINTNDGTTNLDCKYYTDKGKTISKKYSDNYLFAINLPGIYADVRNLIDKLDADLSVFLKQTKDK